MRAQIGTTLGPFEAWLLMRGMRTLDVRVREQAKTAALLAHWLDRSSGIDARCFIPASRPIPATTSRCGR